MKRYVRVAVFAGVLLLALSACGGLSEAEQHYRVGVEHQEEGRLAEAIAEYDEAIRLDPQYSGAYNNRGNAYLDLAQPQRAIRDLDEAIRLDPQLALAYANRGSAYGK